VKRSPYSRPPFTSRIGNTFCYIGNTFCYAIQGDMQNKHPKNKKT
jgi:hypothetical protein